MKEFESIRQWARDRDLIEGSTPAHQLCKLIEEIGELAEGISKKRWMRWPMASVIQPWC
ncbi:MAG: hypothetical protein ACNA8O_15375 [Cyanobacteriota bacterium]